jgi:prepilin-type processing-associated H-X9-DG protein
MHRRHLASLLRWSVIVGAIVLAAGWWKSWERASGYRLSCQSNMKQISLSFRFYTQAFDSHFPPAKIGGDEGGTCSARVGVNDNVTTHWSGIAVGWADVLAVYSKNETMYYCPTSGATIRGRGRPMPAKSSYTDFWFNTNLSAINKSSIASPRRTIVSGDGRDGTEITDATYNKSGLPPDWLTDHSKPCWRHLGGANYAFGDGHVKWLKPNEITTTPGQANTFAVR